MPDQRIVRLVSTEGKNRTLELEDGSVVVRSEGSVSWRNNNPGNLKFEFAGSADKTVTNTRTREDALAAAQHRFQGVVDLDQWGNAVFESYEAGRAAKIQLLENRHANHTVEQLLPSYSRADYSGQTNHSAQAAAIFAEGDRQGVDLRSKTVGQMTQAERAALADGIRRFEGWQAGDTQTIRAPTSAQATPAAGQQAASLDHPGSAAIYSEARRHFFDEGRHYEYGRPDAPRPGRDASRLERDLDGDGRLGVDCSAFVWRGLKNAGYDVPGNTADGFTTSTLFNGSRTTAYAREHFDVTSASDARRPGGNLQQGDILMFSGAGGQHVGIFKGYDAQGRIQFIGSQSSSGPDEVTIKPGGYWDGGTMNIVGSLRAKPEFQVRAPQHGGDALPTRTESTAQHTNLLLHGDRGEGVRTLQQQLNQLGVRDAHGKPLTEDGRFGDNTRDAVRTYQQTHGLLVDGKAGTQTLGSLREQLRAPQEQAQAPQRQTPAEADPLVKAVRERMPEGTTPEVAANVALQAKQSGIDSADKLRSITVQDDKAYVLGTTPGFRAVVDLQQPAPPLEQTNARLLASHAAQPQNVQEEQQRIVQGGR